MRKTVDEQEKEKQGSFPQPQGETEHRFVVLYRRMPDSGDLFFNKKSLWQQYQKRGGEMMGIGWLTRKRCSRVVRLFAQEGKQYSSPTRFPYRLP